MSKVILLCPLLEVKYLWSLGQNQDESSRVFSVRDGGSGMSDDIQFCTLDRCVTVPFEAHDGIVNFFSKILKIIE